VSNVQLPLESPEPVRRGRLPNPSKTKAKVYEERTTYKAYPVPKLEPEPGISYAIQDGTCLASKTKTGQHTQCHMCVNRQVGNICLFRGVRSFPVNPMDQSHTPTGPPLFLNSTVDDDIPEFPVNFNQPFTLDHANRIKTVAAVALLPTLQRELAHASQPNARRIKLGLAERSLCDTCLHAMFGAKFQCYLCAREQCLDCHAKLGQIATDAAEGGVSLGRYAFDNRNDADLKRILKCSGRTGENPNHSPTSFIPLTRFKLDDLARWVNQMTAWQAEHPIPPTPTVTDDVLEEYYSAGHPVDGNQNFLRVPVSDFDQLPTFEHPPSQTCSLRPTPALARSNVRPVAPSSAAEMDKASNLFHGLWSKGETMVVDVSPLGLDHQAWTPARFAASVAEVECIVASNRTGIERISTVGQFFGQFGKGDTSGQSQKIKVSNQFTSFRLTQHDEG